MAKNAEYCFENIKRREVIAALVFSVLTFGIYMVYWFVNITNDSNAVSKYFGTGKVTACGGKAILFTIFSFGLYYLYWSYQLALKLRQNPNRFLICALFFGGIVNYIDAQMQLNSLCDEYKRRKLPNSSLTHFSVDEVNPFTIFSKEDFAATGIPSEVYDYCVLLKPGDIILKIFGENDNYVFELYNDGNKHKFARKDFGFVPRIENGVVQLYFALVPLSEPLKSMADKIVFRAEKGENGFTELKPISDDSLIQELQKESERLQVRIANARK